MEEEKVSLSSLANALILAFEKATAPRAEEKMRVNPLISKFASWYEKFRTAMDYREEEVILRASIERILKRRLILGGTGKTIAEPLIRELVWARYILDENLSEPVIEKAGETIDLYLELKNKIIAQNFSQGKANEFFYNLTSSDLVYILNPKKEKEVMSNFMFQVIKDNIVIADDTVQTKDVQVYIAVRKSFSKDDIAFLEYHLFTQYFGRLTKNNIIEIASNFQKGFIEITGQLEYKRKDRIYAYVKSKSAIFFILEDILRVYKGGVRELAKNKEELEKAVFGVCEARYKTISGRIQRAIVRSVIFILFTKAFFALGIEGSVENLLYGQIIWGSIILNTTIPPALMVLASLFIKTPGRDNSKRILRYIEMLLFNPKPLIGEPLILRKNPESKKPFINFMFTFLWFLAFFIAFGAVVFVLTKLHFTILSQAVFLFFLTIVSFLSYRINLMSKAYTVEEKTGLLAPLIDFLFMPVVRVGRHLTEGIVQINILLFVLDFIIETPLKGLSAFAEQWFFFLHAKREELE